jgi:hypothetical protein
MVIAKVVQNLANNIFFGKEAHMVCLNDYLRKNIVIVTRYLSEVNVGALFFFLPSARSCHRLFRNTRQLQPQPQLTTILTNG